MNKTQKEKKTKKKQQTLKSISHPDISINKLESLWLSCCKNRASSCLNQPWKLFYQKCHPIKYIANLNFTKIFGI